jgi:uncharacterized protein YcnI
MMRLVPDAPVAVLVASVMLLAPATGMAHAVVEPGVAAPGAYQRYVLRVPNERDDTPTTRVEMRFPADVRVISFADVSGWRLEVHTDSAGRIVGAAWTGTLEPHRFVEFPFVAVNPPTATRLVWAAYQTYANGERVEWVGPEESEAPASVTVVRAAGDGARTDWPLYVAALSLLLAIAAVALSLRPRAR